MSIVKHDEVLGVVLGWDDGSQSKWWRGEDIQGNVAVLETYRVSQCEKIKALDTKNGARLRKQDAAGSPYRVSCA